MGERGSSSGRAGTVGAEQTTEYKYEQIIGNGRSTRSQLDSATTLQQVEEIRNKMQNVISSDKTLDKQDKVAFKDATERRVQEATVRVSPVSNKKEMVSFIKQQIGIDISKYIEDKAGHPRTYLGIHIEKMPKTEQVKLRNLMQKKGVRIGDNGGLGYTLHYIKK